MQDRFLQSFGPGSLLRALVRALVPSRANTFSSAPVAEVTQALSLDLLRHELRAPVTGILGMCELLQKSDLNCEQLQLANAMEASGKQLLSLISRFGSRFDIADAPVTGATGPGKQALNGPILMEHVIRAHWPDAQRKGIGLFLLYDHLLPACWYSDIACLRQLLDNLLSNAIKFTHQGYVLVEARPGQLNSSGRVDVELRVSDTGIGIARRDARRIYSIREQGSGDIADRFGGSGLGLHVCSRMAALLGGCITHESSATGRASFRVELPDLAMPGAGEFDCLRSGLLRDIHCLLAVKPPLAAVLGQLLLRIGVAASITSARCDLRIPVGGVVVIDDSSLLAARQGQQVGASEHNRVMLLSRRYMSSTFNSEDRQELDVTELPQPLLRSNLEPLLLRLALQQKLQMQASGDG